MKDQFMKLKTIILLSFLMIIAASIPSCIELVDADYSYQDNVIFIDAYALTEAGTSTVTISRSRWDEISYSVKLIPNAKVQLENIDAGLTIECLNEYDASPYNIFPELETNNEGMYELSNKLYPLLFELKATKI